MSKEVPGCQHSAGILDINNPGKLTETAYNRIIKNIIDDGKLGFSNVHPDLPCAADLGIPTAVGLVPEDLYDKEKYPDFHKNVMGNFEAVALALDVKGNFSLPFPFWDPFAIALSLNLAIPSFDLPDLPTLTPPDLALALNIKIPELPDIQALLSIPKLPEFKPPTIDFNFNLPPDWLQLFDFQLWPLKLPEILLKLIIPDLNFVIGMISIPPNVCPVIKKVADAGLFGPANAGDLSKAIAIGELTAFTGQCLTITAVSMLVGDGGPAGITGQLGTQYGFRKAEPAAGNDMDSKARNTLIQAFKEEFNREPTLKEVQFAQLVARGENGYGTAWPGPRNNWPAQATQSNNWGNIHGKGSAGSFTFIDYDSEGKKYQTSYAMYSSPVDGARALLRQLYVQRPYVLEAIQNDKSLYKPIFLMSSRAVFGNPGYKTKKPGDDAIIPPSAGGLTYYEAAPEIYLKNARAGLKIIMKALKEETDFDIEATSNVPYDPSEVSDEKNKGSGVVVSDDYLQLWEALISRALVRHKSKS